MIVVQAGLQGGEPEKILYLYFQWICVPVCACDFE